MDRRRLKFMLLIGGVVASMSLLLVVGMSREGTMLYYLTVSEFLQQPDPGARDFRVNGRVEPGSIERLPTGQDVRFVMTDGTGSVPVTYHGIIPDTFVDEAAVVVEGRLQGDGSFRAHTLLAKCPSKYEAAEDGPAGAIEASLDK
jgi:cytochrome c-type biogenesis protein CcmE